MRPPSTILLNRLHFPITTLGPGRRIGLWTQGCSVRCPGCVSRDTWTATSTHRVPLADVYNLVASWLPAADGITISGGEPLDQPRAIHALLRWLRARWEGDVLLYSGHAWAMIQDRAPWLGDLVDVVISGPYRPRTGSTRIWRGSDNQVAHVLTERGRLRFGENLNHTPWPAERKLDVMVTDNETWLAGIPQPGALPRLRQALARRGFNVRTSADHSELPCRA